MRQITRRFLAGLLLLGLGLLALGAVPSYLGSGDPYYLVVTSTADEGPAADVTNVSDRRYPFLTSALAADDGRSEPYRRGAFGLKEEFAHSPFDEFDALAIQHQDARDGDRIRIEADGQRYYLEIQQP
ncbi:MAG: hypothetical protein ACQETI_11185 [Halobacteriota archaeon]